MNPNQDPHPTSVPGGPREDQSLSLVLLCGLATASLALAGVYFLDRSGADIHIMGWYACRILPLGAVLVGCVAATGYSLASWLSGIKITRSLLVLVFFLQLFSYFGAQYVEFQGRQLVHRRSGIPVGFLEYYERSARMMAWKNDRGEISEPLGAWGYAVRALEVLGFIAGGLIIPLKLWKSPYCEPCQRYMRHRPLGLVPSSVPEKTVRKSDAAGTLDNETEQRQAAETGKQTVESLQQLALDGRVGEFKKRLAELGLSAKQTMKLPARFSLQLVHCRRCFAGSLVAKQLSGHGKRLKESEYSSAELHPEFVRSICQLHPSTVCPTQSDCAATELRPG